MIVTSNPVNDVVIKSESLNQIVINEITVLFPDKYLLPQ